MSSSDRDRPRDSPVQGDSLFEPVPRLQCLRFCECDLAQTGGAVGLPDGLPDPLEPLPGLLEEPFGPIEVGESKCCVTKSYKAVCFSKS